MRALRLDKLFTKVGKNPTLRGLELGVQCITYRVDWIPNNEIYSIIVQFRVLTYGSWLSNDQFRARRHGSEISLTEAIFIIYHC